MALLSSFIDPFTDPGTPDPLKWIVYDFSDGDPAVMEGGIFRLYDASAGNVYLDSVDFYDFDSASVVVDFAAVEPGSYEFIVFESEWNIFIGFRIRWGIAGEGPGATDDPVLEAYWEGYTNATEGTPPPTWHPSGNYNEGYLRLPYDSETMQYLLITQINDIDHRVLDFYTSSNGIDWNNIYSFTADLPPGPEQYGIEMIADEGTTVYLFDLNIVPQSSVIEVPVASPVDIESFAPTVTMLTSFFEVTVPSLSEFVRFNSFAPVVSGIEDYLEISVPVPSTHIRLSSFSPEVLTFRVLLAAPADDTEIPTGIDSEFSVVILANTENVSVDFQLAVTEEFLGASSVNVEAIDTDGFAATKYIHEDTLNPGAGYYWRYRLHVGDLIAPWSESFYFVVDADSGSATYTGSWTISSPEDMLPIIWFLYPASGETGESVTIYGQGLNQVTAQVFIGETEADITSKESVPTDSELPAIIDETSGTVTVAHDEIVFVIPEIETDDEDYPGDELTVMV